MVKVRSAQVLLVAATAVAVAGCPDWKIDTPLETKITRPVFARIDHIDLRFGSPHPRKERDMPVVGRPFRHAKPLDAEPGQLPRIATVCVCHPQFRSAASLADEHDACAIG